MALILNADDYGKSKSSDDAIILMHKLGIVSSTTIIANGDTFNTAADILSEYPRLGTGVHLCLDGPYNIGNNYSTIIDRKTNKFYNHDQIISKIKNSKVDESEIYREYCLQIEKIMDHRITISHLDHHHHLHIYLPILNSMIRAAKKYNIKYIRPQKMFLYNNKNCLKHIYRYFHHLYLRSRIQTIDGFYSPSITDSFNYEYHFKRLTNLLKINNKLIEIMLHPINKNDPETIFFTSSEVLSLLKRHRIISYTDLLQTV